jgi:hypothetical protein
MHDSKDNSTIQLKMVRILTFLVATYILSLARNKNAAVKTDSAKVKKN